MLTGIALIFFNFVDTSKYQVVLVIRSVDFSLFAMNFVHLHLSGIVGLTLGRIGIG